MVSAVSSVFDEELPDLISCSDVENCSSSSDLCEISFAFCTKRSLPLVVIRRTVASERHGKTLIEQPFQLFS